jgi:hypothetical protein
MTDHCPFCKAEDDTDAGRNHVYLCKTSESVGLTNTIYLRSHICYERQIIHLTEIIREAREVVYVVATAEQSGGVDDNHYIFRKFGMKTKAQTLLPKMIVIAINMGLFLLERGTDQLD